MSVNDSLQRFGSLPNSRQIGALELELRCWVGVVRAAVKEMRSRTGLHWKHGFNSTSWQICQLAENNHRDYLSDLAMAAKGYKNNGVSNPIMDNKELVSRLLEVHQVPHPPWFPLSRADACSTKIRDLIPTCHARFHAAWSAFHIRYSGPSGPAEVRGYFFYAVRTVA